MSIKSKSQSTVRLRTLAASAAAKCWCAAILCVGMAHAADDGTVTALEQPVPSIGRERVREKRDERTRFGQSKTRDDELFETEVREYCRHVAAVAATEAASLKYPWVFVDAGVIPVHSLEPSTTADPARSNYFRLRSGLGFSPSRYIRGRLTGARAKAECERFRAERRLQREVAAKQDVSGQCPGWKAKLAVIEGALPKARELVERVRAEATTGRATVLELDDMEFKFNRLRDQASEARLRLAELGDAPPEPVNDTTRLVRDRIAAEGEVERLESSLRRSSVFDVSVTGGVDRFFGANQRMPLFAMLGLTFNSAWFVTNDFEQKAATARARQMAAAAGQLVSGRLEHIERLRAVHASQLDWLRQISAFRVELEGRMARIARIEGEKSRAYIDQIWFEVVRLRAEEAYLSESMRELARTLGLEADPELSR